MKLMEIKEFRRDGRSDERDAGRRKEIKKRINIRNEILNKKSAF